MNCTSCSAETTNGLVLCDLCQMHASKCLEFLPVYFRNLARWRPGRSGVRPVPGSRMPSGLGTAGDDRVSEALDEAGNAITTWARSLQDDRGVVVPDTDDEPSMVAAACRVLAENLTSIGTLEWAGEFVQGVGEHEEALRKLTETAVPGWYAGACHLCTAPTYVVPGLTWVTCRACGSTTYARDHLETILVEARGWIARPMRLAEAVVALVDTEQSVPRLHKRISKWGERGRIDAHRRLDKDGDECGPKRFRLGEVLDALATDGATRLDEDATVKAS